MFRSISAETLEKSIADLNCAFDRSSVCHLEVAGYGRLELRKTGTDAIEVHYPWVSERGTDPGFLPEPTRLNLSSFDDHNISDVHSGLSVLNDIKLVLEGKMPPSLTGLSFSQAKELEKHSYLRGWYERACVYCKELGQSVLDLSNDPLQNLRTLAHHNLLPKFRLTFDQVAIDISDGVDVDDHTFFLALVTKDEMSVLRHFYFSQTHGAIRLLPLARWKDGRVDFFEKLAGISGAEDYLNLHTSLQEGVLKALTTGELRIRNDIPADVVEFGFPSYSKESKDRLNVLQYSPWLNPFYPRPAIDVKILASERSVCGMRQNFDVQQFDWANELLPNVKVREALASTSNSIYGDITYYSCRSHDKALKYLFAVQESTKRPWIASVSSSDTGVNTFGLPESLVSSSYLFTPLICRKEELPAGYKVTEIHSRDLVYSWNFLSELPPIREFYQSLI